MNIALICNEYPPRPHGGIGTFVSTLAKGLVTRGHNVIVVGLGEAAGERSDGDIRVITLRANKTRFVGSVISRFRLWHFLSLQARASKINLIEVPEYLGLLPLRVGNCCTVVRLHLSTTAIYRQAGLRIPRTISFYERRTLRANPDWIGVSQYILESTKDIFRISPQLAVQIYNPVPCAPDRIPEMPGLPEHFVLYAGTLSKRKGALALAEAARFFLAHHPFVHLVYVGAETVQPGIGPIFKQVQQIVGPGLAPRVHFLGRVDRERVLACMKRARVFVFPSALEALPLVMLEAMSCGVPLVCTSLPPGPEIIEDGVNGFLADPNHPTELGVAVDRLLDDPSLAAGLAAKARRTVTERFSLERCIDETEVFYQQCLQSMNEAVS
jgi:glycosyltransferase involved in cell wall biosynthesis